jgi:hypothetical protein
VRSGRHAVNYPRSLHLVESAVSTDAARPRSTGGLHVACRQGLTTPVRMPSPATITATSSISRTGSRSTPARYATSPRAMAATPWAHRLVPGRPTHPVTSLTGGPLMMSPFDYNQHLLAYLHAWRQLWRRRLP